MKINTNSHSIDKFTFDLVDRILLKIYTPRPTASYFLYFYIS